MADSNDLRSFPWHLLPFSYNLRIVFISCVHLWSFLVIFSVFLNSVLSPCSFSDRSVSFVAFSYVFDLLQVIVLIKLPFMCLTAWRSCKQQSDTCHCVFVLRKSNSFSQLSCFSMDTWWFHTYSNKKLIVPHMFTKCAYKLGMEDRNMGLKK